MYKAPSTYRGKVEIGGVYLPFQLERIHHNFVRDSRHRERGRAGVHSPPSPGWADFFHHDGLYARKWQLPLCVLCGTKVAKSKNSPFRILFFHLPGSTWQIHKIGVSEVSRKNKKGGVIIPDDNIT